MLEQLDVRTPEAKRLAQARLKRGFKDAKAAAEFFGWNYNTYSQHERGERGLRKGVAEKYAKAYRVSPAWLTTGEGGAPTEVPVVGYVGAGALYYPFESQEPIDYVPAPENSNEKTVAVEVRGESLGPLFDRWLVYYDEMREQPSSRMIGHMCVVGLTDGRIMVKKIRRGQIAGLYNLFSNTEPPIYDVAVDWCALVKNMSPR